MWLGPDRHPLLAAAIERGGGRVVADPTAATAIVWSGGRPPEIRVVLHPGIEWVQLDSAGVDRWVGEGLVDPERRWTAVHGAYAPDVAEHAVAFLLAAARRLPQAARRNEWRTLDAEPLARRTVGLVGAGSIGRETIARLRPFGASVLALTRSGRAVDGADRSFGPGGLDELLHVSDYVVLALPLTPETRKLIGERELDLVGARGWIVNVGRGPLVDTDALVRALTERRIAGACLDVTDPEPLPAGHPLWRFENVLITPHVANPPGTIHEPLARLVEENVRRFAAGRDLLGEIDPGRGY